MPYETKIILAPLIHNPKESPDRKCGYIPTEWMQYLPYVCNKILKFVVEMQPDVEALPMVKHNPDYGFKSVKINRCTVVLFTITNYSDLF